MSAPNMHTKRVSASVSDMVQEWFAKFDVPHMTADLFEKRIARFQHTDLSQASVAAAGTWHLFACVKPPKNSEFIARELHGEEFVAVWRDEDQAYMTEEGEGLWDQSSMDLWRPLITPDQRIALQAAIDAAVAEARAEDAAVLSKLIEATETARDYVSDASMGYVWHQDQSGSPLVKLDTKMPKDDIKAIDAALAAARDVEAALAQIGAKP